MKNNTPFIFSFLITFLLTFNSLSQCPTIVPNGIDSCALAAGSVELNASSSSGFYSWYDALVGGNFLATGSSYNTPHLTATTTYYVAATKDNIGLDFDGTNDFVALGNPASLQITGDMTIEMWLKPDNFSARRNPYAKAYGGEGTITQETNGTINYYYGTNGGNGTPYQGFNTTQQITLNQWTHIAIVRDLTNMKLLWYINGVLVNQANATYPAATAGANPALIGSGYVSNYDGQIDELRIWNTARTLAEINTNKDQCLLGTEAGLVSYYQLEDGAGVQATDLTANLNHGTLTNMDPATDWVSVNHDYSCIACESARTAVTATISGGIPLSLGSASFIDCNNSTGVLLDAGNSYTNYLWNTGETTSSITAPISGTYWVQVDDGASCSDSDTSIVSISSSSKNTIQYNGTTNSILVGNPDNLQITGDLTIEMWLKPDNFSARRNPYAKAYGGEGTITQETNGALNFYHGTNGGNGTPYQGFNSSQALTLNEWNHIAIVRNATTQELFWYINGILTNQVASAYPLVTAGNNPITIADGYTNNYAGQIDELRVWNSARTQTQIRDKMCSKILNSDPNLQLYYRFDEGAGTTTADLSGYNNQGSLINSPTWATSSASIGDESSYLYTSSWGGATLNHTVCSGENLTISNMTGTPDGVHIYSIGSVPDDVTGIVGLGSNDRYFGVHKVNDNAATYDATYDYALNPYVDLNNDVNLLLFKRSNNATTPWVNTGEIPNIVANTITNTASGTEFILGASVSPLPITLLNFNVINNNGNVDILWTTLSEVNNDYFIIEKSRDGEYWTDVARVNGAGNSSTTLNYFESDYSPFHDISFYRLKQVDFDGKTSYSKKVSINIISEDITVFPNPFNTEINITNLSKNQSIKIYSMDGKLIYTGNSSLIYTENWVRGLYELIIFNQNNSITNRFKIIK